MTPARPDAGTERGAGQVSRTPRDWKAPYWRPERHGSAWLQVQPALHRVLDALPRRPPPPRGCLPDTFRHPAPLEPFPEGLIAREDVQEAAVRYGVGARHQYGELYDDWDDVVEQRLRQEWSEAETGVSFVSVRDSVRIGWFLHE